ncbi:aldehyde dehydrogenase family protein [Stygiolobus caldivivus]|uniref:L-glutamate gamma-semialdehyde dehydrogenase n=1 Tax=Stygiolobus caldivivus TaxID=2824673 RepID=A0A8D5ZI01_9CREN|nr:aldehyde dehydrogenase family protein [Stygiolobus caldivivus]BCU70169.1 1-pyrroline-5-carboxylate dehydrogenase [Stygiolobus caldivivus]
MAFTNENTVAKYKGREEEFHQEFEKALEKVRLGEEYPILIGGEEVRTGKTFEVRSPIDTSLVIGRFQMADENSVDKAFRVAREAYREWRLTSWRERVELAKRTAELMRRRKFELAATITLENGKNRYEAVGEVDEAIDYFEYYAYILQLNRGFSRDMESRMYKNEHSFSVMKPYGAWAVIAPFNFPLAITTTMSLGAVITGNTAVVKPSSDTPLSAFNLVKIMLEAGFPAGVINYVTGSGKDIADLMLSRADGLAFTGSKDVGHSLAKRLIEKDPRPIVMELGGKNPVVVTDKADLDKATEGVYRGAFGFGGQKCSATSRVFVFESVHDRFVEKLVNKVKEIKVGDPRKREVFLGPIINKGAVEKYKKFVDEAVKNGGKIAVGGKVIDEDRGYYVEPTVITGLPYEHWMWKTELFVPILLVGKVKTLEEAVRMANDVEYGLTAGIFSEDKKEVEYFFDNIEAGVVYANRTVGATTGAMPGVQPFGGWKHSGWTGKNAGGPYYLLSFLREQALTYYD